MNEILLTLIFFFFFFFNEGNIFNFFYVYRGTRFETQKNAKKKTTPPQKIILVKKMFTKLELSFFCFFLKKK